MNRTFRSCLYSSLSSHWANYRDKHLSAQNYASTSAANTLYFFLVLPYNKWWCFLRKNLLIFLVLQVCLCALELSKQITFVSKFQFYVVLMWPLKPTAKKTGGKKKLFKIDKNVQLVLGMGWGVEEVRGINMEKNIFSVWHEHKIKKKELKSLFLF